MIIIKGKKVSELPQKEYENKKSRDDKFRFNTLKEAQTWNDSHKQRQLK